MANYMQSGSQAVLGKSTQLLTFARYFIFGGLMGKTVNVPMFLEHEYDAILALGDLELPVTFDGWLEHRAKEKAKHTARGDIENETIVHPQEFALYCQRCGQDISLATIGAFVVAKASGYK